MRRILDNLLRSAGFQRNPRGGFPPFVFAEFQTVDSKRAWAGDKIAILALLFALGGISVRVIVREYIIPAMSPDIHSRRYLKNVAAMLSKDLPKEVDAGTELFKVDADEGMLLYEFRLKEVSTSEAGRQKFSRFVKKTIPKAACSNSATRDGILKQGIQMRYTYFDKDYRHILDFDVAPSDCGF